MLPNYTKLSKETLCVKQMLLMHDEEEPAGGWFPKRPAASWILESVIPARSLTNLEITAASTSSSAKVKVKVKDHCWVLDSQSNKQPLKALTATMEK